MASILPLMRNLKHLRTLALTEPGALCHAICNRLILVNITVTDLDVESAIRTCTYPSFVVDRRSLATKIRERHEITDGAFLTLGEFHETTSLHIGFGPTGA